jgi:CubicO group peptidase (beta-lactamase class C family)
VPAVPPSGSTRDRKRCVTGRPIAELVTQRIIEPLDLRDTYWPTGADGLSAGDSFVSEDSALEPTAPKV